jgi:hypothetical protein
MNGMYPDYLGTEAEQCASIFPNWVGSGIIDTIVSSINSGAKKLVQLARREEEEIMVFINAIMTTMK